MATREYPGRLNLLHPVMPYNFDLDEYMHPTWQDSLERNTQIELAVTAYNPTTGQATEWMHMSEVPTGSSLSNTPGAETLILNTPYIVKDENNHTILRVTAAQVPLNTSSITEKVEFFIDTAVE